MTDTYQDHYRILGLYKSANEQDIKSAYHKLILKYHPDKNTSVEDAEFCKKINLAYNVLSESSRRAAFDHIYDKRNAIFDPISGSWMACWMEKHWKRIFIFIGGTTAFGCGAYYLIHKFRRMDISPVLPLATITPVVPETPLRNLDHSLNLFQEITKIDDRLQYAIPTSLIVTVVDSIRSSFTIISKAWQNNHLIINLLQKPVNEIYIPRPEPIEKGMDSEQILSAVNVGIKVTNEAIGKHWTKMTEKTATTIPSTNAIPTSLIMSVKDSIRSSSTMISEACENNDLANQVSNTGTQIFTKGLSVLFKLFQFIAELLSRILSTFSSS